MQPSITQFLNMIKTELKQEQMEELAADKQQQLAQQITETQQQQQEPLNVVQQQRPTTLALAPTTNELQRLLSQHQQQHALPSTDVLQQLLSLPSMGQQGYPFPAPEDFAAQGLASLNLDYKQLYHIHRAIFGKYFKSCTKCRSLNYQNKDKFKISFDQQFVQSIILVCKQCALENINLSIQEKQRPRSNNYNNYNNNQSSQAQMPSFPH